MFFCRSAAICRVSRSVLVKISPFTFTRICSMMSARAKAGARRRTIARTATGNRYLLVIAKSLQTSILPSIQELAQQVADPLEDAARGPRILVRRLENLSL